MTSKPHQQPSKNQIPEHHLLDSTVWNEFEFRADDIIIATYSKTGSTWVQQIVAQLLFQGAEHISVAQISPWLDCRFPTNAEKLVVYNTQTHRRFIKSHLPVDSLVFSPQAKYIYVARDGRDVLWSLYNHHRKFKPDVIRDIDATPARVGPPLGVADPSVLQYFHDWLAKDGYPWWPFWEHVLSWWQVRTLPNVMLVHFTNLKTDMPAEIRKIGGFLDIPIDEAKWEKILKHCSFDYMKAHAAESAPFGGMLWEGGATTFMHKGTIGRWKDTLSAEDIAYYERTARQKLGVDCAHWLATGQFLTKTIP